MPANTNPSETGVRRVLLYTGRVQGVGFRFTTESIASGYAVTGTVRNRVDGRVELVAEGKLADIDAFQDAIAERMRANIADTSTHQSSPTGEFAGFVIAY